VKTSAGIKPIRRTKLRGLALFTAASAGVLALPSVATAGPGDIANPGGPTDIGPSPTSVPAIRPFATCAIRGASTDTYWFGYTSDLRFLETIAVGPSNTLGINRGGIDGGQPDQFRVGSTPFSVAVVVPKNAIAEWQVTSPAPTPPAPQVSPVFSATADASTIACAEGTPARSANVRMAGASFSASTYWQYRSGGLLRDAYDAFTLSGTTTACTAGNKSSGQLPLWGFNTPGSGTIVSGFQGTSPYRAMPAALTVRTDQFSVFNPNGTNLGTASFVRSWLGVRRVDNPQRTSTVFVPSGPQVTLTGATEAEVLADVHGKCYYGTAPYVVSNVGFSESFVYTSVTDIPTQSHRAMVACGFGQLPAAGICDVPKTITGPGGNRIQRF
jgi:hypothetical protein